MILLVDATILLKAFVSEAGQADASRLLGAELDLVVPDVAFVELGRLVAKKVAAGELSEAHGLAILDTAPTFVRAVGLNGPIVRRGYEIGRELGLTIVDGLYLAVAESLDAPIVTADFTLAVKTQGTAFESRVVELGAALPR
jgi:predicted nucleic acid-binding protein